MTRKELIEILLEACQSPNLHHPKQAGYGGKGGRLKLNPKGEVRAILGPHKRDIQKYLRGWAKKA